MTAEDAAFGARPVPKGIATEAFAKVEVRTIDELDSWLEAHHASEASVWLITFKKHVPDRYITMSDTLDVLMRHGWIDGLRRKLDDDRTMQLISKRRQQKWSQSYKDRVERLTANGRMRPWGLAAVADAKRNGTWDAYTDVDALVVPDDLTYAFSAAGRGYFDQCGASYQRNVLRWVAQAKGQSTRRARIAKLAEACANGRRLPQM